jgi:hypothetical protein
MTLSANLNTIQVNGVEYVRKDSIPGLLPEGNREVVVMDRGWIYAGDVIRANNGDLEIYNPIHVFRWEEIGYTGVLENPNSKKVTLKTCPYPVKVPAGSVIYTNPVPSNWGI